MVEGKKAREGQTLILTHKQWMNYREIIATLIFLKRGDNYVLHRWTHKSVDAYTCAGDRVNSGQPKGVHWFKKKLPFFISSEDLFSTIINPCYWNLHDAYSSVFRSTGLQGHSGGLFDHELWGLPVFRIPFSVLWQKLVTRCFY